MIGTLEPMPSRRLWECDFVGSNDGLHLLALQFPNKDLDAYIRRFHKRSLDNCDPVTEDVLVDICLQCMITSFSRLMEDMTRTNESVKKITRYKSGITPSLKKKSLAAKIEANGRSQASSSKKGAYRKGMRLAIFLLSRPFMW